MIKSLLYFISALKKSSDFPMIQKNSSSYSEDEPYQPCYHFYSSIPHSMNLNRYNTIPCRYNRRILSQPCCGNIRHLVIFLYPSSVRLSEAIFHKLSCIPLSQRDFSVTENIHVLSSSRCLFYKYTKNMLARGKSFVNPKK